MLMMNPEPKSRVEESVPKPDAAQALSEEEKAALEKSGEVEHAHGEKRDELAKEAEKQG